MFIEVRQLASTRARSAQGRTEANVKARLHMRFRCDFGAILRTKPAPAYPARVFSRVTLRRNTVKLAGLERRMSSKICHTFLSNPLDASRKKKSCRVGLGAFCTRNRIRNRIKNRMCKRALMRPVDARARAAPLGLRMRNLVTAADLASWWSLQPQPCMRSLSVSNDYARFRKRDLAAAVNVFGKRPEVTRQETARHAAV